VSEARLDAEAWEKFCKALEEPAKTLPGLKEFLELSSVFEQQKPKAGKTLSQRLNK